MRFAGRKTGDGVDGTFGKVSGALAGGGYAIMPIDEHDRMGKILITHTMPGNSIAPEAAFVFTAARISKDDWKCHLAIAEIIALPLAHFRGGRIIIYSVINQLEGNT